ncbi:MAG: hypothetical protein M1834_004345 [Cirrosporium novae-zelandiae]|nr:MAG: hypothetical protein M1834_004345 [Cirrosporium novae-zelandiae]
MDLSKILNPLSEKTPKKNLMSRAPSPLRRPETMPIVYPNTASCSSVLHPDDVQRHSPFTKLGQKLPSFMASGRRQHVPPSLHLSHSNGSSTIYSANSSPIQMPEFPLPPTQTPILAYGAISSLSSARAKAKANGYLPPTHFSHSNLGSVGESSMSHNTLPTYNGLLNSHTPHYSTTAQETPDANQTSACNGLWLGRDAGTGSADESDEETTPRPKGVTLDLELGSAKLAEDQNDVFSNWPFTSTSIARNSLDRRMISYPESPMSMGGIPVSALVASPVPTYGSFIPVEPPHGYRTPPPPLAEVKFNQFSILDALCDYPELLFEMVKYLNVDELVNIYAIHKQAHFTINYRFTHVVKLITNMHAPESAEIFQFNLFRDLCMTDPAGRPHPRILGDIRNVPTFRWLRCILFREQVVSDIIDLLAAKGLRLPRPATKVFKMIWLLMDMPTNELRKGYLHSKSWTERDIWCALLIIMKVEMAFTDPEDGQGEPWAYRMMWAQKSLSTLRDVFAGNAGNNQLTNLQMYVRWKIPSGTFDPGAKDLPLMGVPAKETGMLQYEGWGVGRPVLLMRPDEMFEREAIQRGLDVHARHVDLLLWGFIDEATRLDIPISAGTLPTDKLVTIIDEDADAESVLVKDKEVEEGSSNVADDEEEIDNGREEGESNSDDSGAESIDYKNMVPEFN